MIGAWLSPPITILGTLWLARRSERLRLRIKVRLYHEDAFDVVNGGMVKICHILFSVTNTSRRPVTLESVGWAYRRKWRWHVEAERETKLPRAANIRIALARSQHG